MCKDVFLHMNNAGDIYADLVAVYSTNAPVYDTVFNVGKQV